MLSPVDIWIFFEAVFICRSYLTDRVSPACDIFKNTGADFQQEQKMLLIPEQLNCVSVYECAIARYFRKLL